MKRIKLTPAQFGWLCARLQETYRAAGSQVQDLESWQTISYYKRNNAENVRLRALADAKNTMAFCEAFRDAIV